MRAFLLLDDRKYKELSSYRNRLADGEVISEWCSIGLAPMPSRVQPSASYLLPGFLMMLHLASCFSALTLIALPLAAQDIQAANGGRDDRPKPVVERPVEIGDSADRGSGGAVPRPAKPVVSMKLARYASPLVSFKPERLAPGERGEAVIILALQKKAVFATTANIQVDYKLDQGPLNFGSWSIDPPKEAEVESFFKGKRVYDNFAIIRIPVQVKSKVALRDFRAVFQIKANVSAGDTGHDHGRFGLSAHGELKIGKSIPRPTVQMPDVSEEQGDVVVETKPYTGPGDVAAPAVAAGHKAASAVDVASTAYTDEGSDPALASSDAEMEAPAPGDGGDGFDWLLYGAPIALLLLGLIAFLARKR